MEYAVYTGEYQRMKTALAQLQKMWPDVNFVERGLGTRTLYAQGVSDGTAKTMIHYVWVV